MCNALCMIYCPCMVVMEILSDTECQLMFTFSSFTAGVVTLKSMNLKNGFVKGQFKFVMSMKSGKLNKSRKKYYYQVQEDVSAANPARFQILSGDLLLMGSSMNKRLVDLNSESLLKQCGENSDILEAVSKAAGSC